jgi:DivIVA domain-containing protein
VERALTTTWYDEDERLTPDALETATFPLSRLGRRGYDEESVNGFLRLVHTEWVRLVNERASLWQEVQRLRRRIVNGEANGEANGHGQAVLFGEADAHIHAVRILSTAQQTADRYVADAQAYSSRVTTEARQRRDHIMHEAQQHSDMVLQDAQARAREAAVSALNLPAPLQTDQERQAMQAELAYLRTYSDVYRAHLRAYTEGVLRGIEEFERKAVSLREAEHENADHLSNGH